GYPGQRAQGLTPPYVAAAVLLDGADIAFQHLVLGCDASEVRMGLRVKAVWGEAGGISHFTPTGEPGAVYESYARSLGARTSRAAGSGRPRSRCARTRR